MSYNFRASRPWLAAALTSGLTLGIAAAVIGLPTPPPATASLPPTACTRVIDGVEWTLDPCIAEGDPIPDDFADAIADLAACPPDATPSATQGAAGANATDSPTPPAPTQPPTPTDNPTPTPTANPTEPPSPDPSEPPHECPPLHDPEPWPGYPPPGVSPSPTPPDPTASQEPIPPVVCEDEPSGAPLLAESPKDEKADLIKCRKKVPDPDKAITLVGAGNSIVSAHHQTGFGIGTCDHTAADDRKLTGNDGNFSFVGRYYKANPQILEYYNFARTGFNTKDIVAAAAADKDACENPWNRVDTPAKLSAKVIKAAKAAGRSAYFVADGGVNNTDWVKLLGQLAKCYGADFTVNNLLANVAGLVGVKVGFYYKVPKVAATDPPDGLKKNIIKKGGACYATAKWFGKTWSMRIDVPAYDGPGSLAPSALSKRISTDIAAAIKTVLDAGADKVVWFLYYDILPAKVDISNLGLAAAKSQLPNWLNQWLPNSVPTYNVPIVDSDFNADVGKMITDLNAEVKKGIAANPKVKAMDAPALKTEDIQNTAVGGCPHPNDSGHDKLKDALKTTFDSI